LQKSKTIYVTFVPLCARVYALCAWYSDLMDGDLFQWEQLFLADHEICCVMMAVSALGYDVMLLCGLLFECLGCQRDWQPFPGGETLQLWFRTRYERVLPATTSKCRHVKL